MDTNKVVRNTIVATSQAIVYGITLFFVYRYVLDALGAESLGVWALVLATTSTASLANLGIATSTTKFVAQYIARDQPDTANSIIQTAAVSVALILGIALPLVYPLISNLIGYLIQSDAYLPEAYLILPYAMLSFWLNSVSGVFQACIDGYQRVDLRGYLLIGASLLYLALVFLLVPTRGIEGLAQAQVIQAGILLIGSWGLLRYIMPALPIVPFRWSTATFKEIIGYSLNFQVIAITQLLLEPVAKALLSRFAGLSTLAYFEMAHRMVFQIRSLIAAGHQAIVPTIADAQERSPGNLSKIYNYSFRLLLFLIVFGLPFCMMLTPFVSWIWIGEYNATFILFANLLFIGWFLNLLANPAYFANLGTGELKWNVIGHIVIGVLNLSLGIALGRTFGGTGITIGFIAALLIGSFIIMMAYHKNYHISLLRLFSVRTVYLALASITALIATGFLFITYFEDLPALTLILINLAVFLLITAWPVWQHPVPRTILSLVQSRFSPSTPDTQPGPHER